MIGLTLEVEFGRDSYVPNRRFTFDSLSWRLLFETFRGDILAGLRNESTNEISWLDMQV